MNSKRKILGFATIWILSVFVLPFCKREGNSGILPILPSSVPGTTCLPGRVPPCLKLTEIVSGLNSPVFVVSPTGDIHRQFVVEQNGKIRLILDGVLQSDPFLDLGTEGSDLVYFSGERGLLGLALHPNYNANGRFWVNYSRKSDGATVVSEYARSSGNPNLANSTSVGIVFTVDQPFSNHNGGMLAFGPDGYLYIGMGDGGGSGDPNNYAQNLESALGKILRIDVDTYPSPAPGNRAVSGLENPHVWDWGFRNPWRFSFDRSTGNLYIADVGQAGYEELDIELSGQGLKNYGWRITEGNHCYNPSLGCNTTGLTLPKLEYDHSVGTCITGGYVYRGSGLPELTGRYFYADFIAGKVWSLVFSGGNVQDILEHTGEIGGSLNISSFGEDANGEIYVVDYGGKIFRIEEQ
ncbi:PQQ-dependent sugar dehydrogenase [Leptospira wolffii]|uniref:PQQ-dependent sugar dehydrogenase n=1 Tax=Leptospira wolffii TaxID=409998 RepID=UPI000A03AB2E|nr:PQQ-dependent sugar dehydrogenase [Leptospira wolffii]